ncbi:MAG: hypothetical protein AB1553_01945 [Nitrospirota bacterium]
MRYVTVGLTAEQAHFVSDMQRHYERMAGEAIPLHRAIERIIECAMLERKEVNGEEENWKGTAATVPHVSTPNPNTRKELTLW